MASLVLYGFIALLAVGVLFALAVWLLPAGEQISPPAPDVKRWVLADHALSADEIEQVKLPVALRGYRFAETDALLDRLGEELRQRDEEIARLRGDEPVADDDATRYEPTPYQPAPYQPAQYEPLQHQPAQYEPVQHQPAQYEPVQHQPPAFEPGYDPTAVREQ